MFFLERFMDNVSDGTAGLKDKEVNTKLNSWSSTDGRIQDGRTDRWTDRGKVGFGDRGTFRMWDRRVTSLQSWQRNS